MARITKEDLEALKAENQVLSESPEDLADRLFKEALPEAVLILTKLSRNAESESVQLRAAQYVTERVLGRLQDVNHLAQKDPLIAMVEGVLVGNDD